MDSVSKKRRSEIMARVRGKNTRPEIIVRSVLHRMGFRFRLHRSGLPGRPDMVLPKWKVAVFVHGCFWHRHEGCPNTRTPKSRVKFWTSKFQGNVTRDTETEQKLREHSWRVLVIWECEIKDLKALTGKIESFIRGGHEVHRAIHGMRGSGFGNGDGRVSARSRSGVRPRLMRNTPVQ